MSSTTPAVCGNNSDSSVPHCPCFRNLNGLPNRVFVARLTKLKPTSPGSRFRRAPDFERVTTDKPQKKLLRPLTRISGRNNNGRITLRRRGGGHKRRYRVIDFRRDKLNIPGKVETVEYDLVRVWVL